LLSWVVFLGFDGETYTRSLFTWIESGSLFTDWAIRVDRLTAIMLIVITTVSALVHLYSFGYMAMTTTSRRARATGRASSPTCRSSPSPC
jgi:NADH-quinone oxidoreductase subunit L